MIDYRKKIILLAKKVKKILDGSPGCHDWQHTERVLRNAKIIAVKEKKVDRLVVELAALLHDICRPEEFKSKGKVCHANLGAEKAVEMLKDTGFTDEKIIKDVSECVRRHRYRANTSPRTLEEKIVFDADKLDSLGAIGIGRAFHFAGWIGAGIHNLKESALQSESYSAEDTAYREYLVKLRDIHKRMLTKTGRKIAVQRHKFMEKYFKRLNKEVFGKSFP